MIGSIAACRRIEGINNMKVPETEGSKIYRVVGAALSLAYILGVLVYVANSGHDLSALAPNLLGDFVAGILGPLGILWLVLGFWQQGDELRSSVRALELQSEELRKSVEQQKALVEITREQAMAEIRALNEEREARRLASMPTLVLSSRGGSSIGPGRISSGLQLTNLGADCSDVKVLDLSNDDFPTVVQSIPALGYGQTVQFHLNHGETDHLNFELRIRFQTRFGEADEVRYWLSRASPGAMGFLVEPYDE
jgi:hypothetical protein